MPLLNFSEIPPATGASKDTEAFEKFAKDFFVSLRGAKITKSVGRGPDGGADLIVTVDGENWLVSCKHYLSGNYVPPEKELDPEGRLKQWGCKKFVAFYSPGPTSGLEQKLRQTQANNPSFVCELMDSGDIEREMIATASAEGWLLAMRWFPSSFARIATSLVFPLRVHSEQSVVEGDDYAFLPGIGLSALFRPRDDAAASEAREILTLHANETATSKAFAGIFQARVEDFVQLVPGSFVKPVFLTNDQLTVHDVFPSWDLTLIRRLASTSNRVGLLNLCRVWSLWGGHLAETAYLYAQLLLQYGDNAEVRQLDGETSIQNLSSHLRTIDLTNTAVIRQKLEELSFSELANRAITTERGYFAALLCFCPGGLRSFIDRPLGAAALAHHHGEYQQLERAAFALAETFCPADRAYVHGKSPTLRQLLVSIKFIQSDALDALAVANPALRCLSDPMIEHWVPAGNPPPFLGKALGFRT